MTSWLLYMQKCQSLKKKVEELKTNTDKWLYVLKNISKLQNLPEELENNIFKKFFDEAEIANYSKDEYFAYQESLKIYRDNKAVLKTAIEEGKKEGRKEGKLTAFYNMIKQGLITLDQAATSLGITTKELLDEFKEYNLIL